MQNRTLFTVGFGAQPIPPTRDGPVSRGEPFSPSLLRCRVLVVEDSEDWQELLAVMIRKVPALELAGYAPSAREAMALFPRVQPDLLILDWHLRDGDGLAVLRLAKRARPACTAVVFTLSNSPRERARCVAGGANHLVSKETPQKLALLLELAGENFRAALCPPAPTQPKL
ncbi:response regulator [Horticoccus sp. 23ND18S-11]|uniref:response regulator n=1 Tax=Horticoccus sp. 23ND18S-11 TaxID=3391832 RepID=UPI0039C8DE36